MSSRRRVGVLALQGDFREHLAALRATEVEGVPVRLATDLENVDALILPGGESTTMARLMQPALRDSIQRRVAAGMPVMGTCAGMILMARDVQDGRMDQEPLQLMDIGVRRNAYGRQIDSSIREGRFGDAPIEMVFIRAPRFERLGPGVEVVATEGDDPVVVRQGKIMAATFHPELSDDTRIHKAFLDLIGNGLHRRA